MIGKVMNGRGFGGLARYLESGKTGNHPERVEWIEARNLPTSDPRTASLLMRATAAQSDRVQKPVYHLAGTACTLEKFFGMIAGQAGLERSWTRLPARIVWHAARLNAKSGLRLDLLPDPVVIEMALHHWDIRSRDAEADLGYSSRPPERTIADTVAWLRANPPGMPQA